MSFKGRAAIITGGGRGIGFESAKLLAEQGCNIVVVDPGGARDGSPEDSTPADDAVKVLEGMGVKAIAVKESIADFDTAGQIVQKCADEFGSVDILINSAGLLRERMVWNMTNEEWRGVLSVHLDGTFNMCRHAAGHMRNQKYGRIITMGSDAWRGTIGQANYGAAKGGIYSLTRALARELGKYGVTANTICPTAATRLTLDQRVKDGFRKRLEAGLITEARYNEVVNMPAAEYIAPLVQYLVSEESAGVNGQCFRAEGTRVSVMADPYEKAAIFKANGSEKFSQDELTDLVPRILLAEYTNPAPSASDDA